MPYAYYERNLPHWQAEDAALFITWRLYGSLPVRPDVIGLPPRRAFAAFDDALAKTDHGPKWLEDVRVAACVADTLKFGQDQLRLYQLLAWVIMPNHVHILVDPKTTLRPHHTICEEFHRSEVQ